MSSSVEHTVSSVEQINEIFGNRFGTAYREDPEAFHKYVAGQMSLVVEEKEELLAALNENDVVECLDAIGDIITVVDGIPFKAGIAIRKGDIEGVEYEIGLFLKMGETEQVLTFTPEYFCWQKLAHLDQSVMFQPSGLSGVNVAMCHAYLVWKYQRAWVEGVCIDMGFDPRKVYDEVHASNMSKTCANLGEVLETLSKYEENYSLKYVGGDDDLTGRFLEAQPESDLMIQQVAGVYVVKANRDIVMNGKPVKAGKFLKGIKFKEPDFSDPSKFKP